MFDDLAYIQRIQPFKHLLLQVILVRHATIRNPLKILIKKFDLSEMTSTVIKSVKVKSNFKKKNGPKTSGFTDANTVLASTL